MSSRQKLWQILLIFATEKRLLFIMLTFSALMNVLLAVQLKDSRTQVESLVSNRKLTIGELATSLEAHDVDGGEVIVNFSDQELPTLIYLQTSSCYWCVKNIPNLLSLEHQATGKYRLVTLFFEAPDQADPSLFPGPNSQVLFDPSVETKISFDLSATPTTILISREGVVQNIWRGGYNAERAAEIESALGVLLPGMRDEMMSSSISDK